MNNLLPLMRREWLQHRFAWALLLLVPLALAVLPLTFGDVQLDNEVGARTGPELALMVATISIVATTTILFLILWISSVFVAVGTPLRDHADRSIEFWLSLPTGHTVSLVAPMLVHLLLVPAVALAAGWAAGVLVSMLTVTRFESLSGWLSLPWAQLLGATAAAVARLIAGVPLATLWLLPLLLLAMVSNALFKRWGLPVLAVTLSVGSSVLQQVFGQPWLAEALHRLGQEAVLAMAGASGQGLTLQGDEDPRAALAALPAWALRDLWAAIQHLASPAFLAAMLASAVLLAALVQWRQRGAGHAGA